MALESHHLTANMTQTQKGSRRLAGDGSETLWIHFLCEIPSADSDQRNRQPQWLKWGFILTWKPKTPGSTTPYATDVTVDPYILVDDALAPWHERIDKVAWDVNSLVRDDEEDIFRRAQMLRAGTDSGAIVKHLGLHRIHTSAKNTIFMVEALDSAIRSVDLALADHKGLLPQGTGGPGNVNLWENTTRRLRHTSDLFHSTRLRTTSCQERIKNTVDLAFYINTAYDSQVNLSNSRSVRVISIVASSSPLFLRLLLLAYFGWWPYRTI
ncbi:hypothetical protein B0H63DRAFT_450561 [Podospora didyma]|uniref:Uncharacterized protein n=1 Tax=Podospora didyma TaxID=330526 RepID=A0AAE0NGS2_9PEZI|nr:hypothetical protein B0H63DRAFT_450561 [Podospora didyma]